jgi:hypothetical protein
VPVAAACACCDRLWLCLSLPLHCSYRQRLLTVAVSRRSQATRSRAACFPTLRGYLVSPPTRRMASTCPTMSCGGPTQRVHTQGEVLTHVHH